MIDQDTALLENSYSSPLDEPYPPEEELPRPDPELMLLWLTSTDVLERMQSARAFCEIEDDRATPLLIKLLEDDCILVRVSAAYALGRNPEPSIVPYLITRLQQEWNGYVRKGIVWTLGNCKDCTALQPLISALRYDISAVRLWAASALGQLGDIVAIAAVAAVLKADRVAAVRSNCTWALGKLLLKVPMGDRSSRNEAYQEAIDTLIDAVEDQDLGVQSDAKVALRKLGDPRGLKVLERIDNEQGYCDYIP